MAGGANEYGRLAGTVMDQAGGLVVINAGLIYVADYEYKCIWEITIG